MVVLRNKKDTSSSLDPSQFVDKKRAREHQKRRRKNTSRILGKNQVGGNRLMKVSPQKKSETSWIGDYAEDFGLVRDEENGSLNYPVENIFGYVLDYQKVFGKSSYGERTNETTYASLKNANSSCNNAISFSGEMGSSLPPPPPPSSSTKADAASKKRNLDKMKNHTIATAQPFNFMGSTAVSCSSSSTSSNEQKSLKVPNESESKKLSQNGWGNKFTPNPGQWKCQDCLVMNNKEDNACQACTVLGVEPKRKRQKLSTSVAPFASLPTAPVAPIQSESNFTAPAFSFGSKHISKNATIGAIPLATNSIPKKNAFNFTATSSNNPSTLTHVNEKDNPAFSFGSSSTPAAGVSAVSTFSFGSSTASQANAPVSVPNVGFSFGAQSKNNTVGAPNFNYSSSSKSTPVTSVFAFGAPVQETQAQPVSAFPNNGFGSGSLGSVPNSIAPSSLGGFNATPVPTPGPANSFTPNTGAVSNGGFSIGTGGGKTRGRRIVRGKRR